MFTRVSGAIAVAAAVFLAGCVGPPEGGSQMESDFGAGGYGPPKYVVAEHNVTVYLEGEVPTCPTMGERCPVYVHKSTVSVQATNSSDTRMTLHAEWEAATPAAEEIEIRLLDKTAGTHSHRELGRSPMTLHWTLEAGREYDIDVYTREDTGVLVAQEIHFGLEGFLRVTVW